MRGQLASGTIVAVITLLGSAAVGRDASSDVDRTMFNMRVAASALQTYLEAREQLPDSGGKLLSPHQLVEALGANLPRDWRDALTARDGWGHPLAFITRSRGFTIFSFGSDGEPDADYGTAPGTVSDTEVVSKPDVEGLRRDVILDDTGFVQRPEPEPSPAIRAMADMRSIGTAIESYAVDVNRYPGPTNGLQPVDVFADALEPVYIESLPRLDPWGKPFLVWSDGNDYLVISAGADGALDADYLTADDPAQAATRNGARTTDPNADIVFAGGQFVRYPSSNVEE